MQAALLIRMIENDWSAIATFSVFIGKCEAGPEFAPVVRASFGNERLGKALS